MTRHRRRVRGRFFVFVVLLLLIIAAIGFGTKTVMDSKAVAGNVSGFEGLIQKDQFDLAHEFYTDVDKTVTGKVREQSLEKMDALLAQRVEDFSRLAKQGPVQAEDAAVAGLKLFSTQIAPMLDKEAQLAFEAYRDGKMEYDRVTAYFESIRLLGAADQAVATYAQQAQDVYNAQEGLRNAQDNITAGNFYEAYKFYASVPQDSDQYDKASAQAQRYQGDAVSNVLSIAATQAQSNKYDAAIQVLTDALAVLPEQAEIQAKLDEYKKADEVAKNDLVRFTGQVEHVFTHSLIAYPEIANQSPSMQQALYRDCVTPYEFQKMLEQLYANDFILIDINMMYEEATDENGKTIVKMADLMLPRGKKPVVLSIDDVVYDIRKMGTGMVDKLIVGDDGRVLTYTKMADGTEQIRDDNEVIPMVDKFVKEHPDFSFNGAKGTLALTGFQGILGYRTQRPEETPEGFDRDTEIAGAKKVIEALKATGWTFASHSYKHGQMKSNMSVASVKDDADKWENEVASLVGPTKVFVYPYGDSVRPHGSTDDVEKLQYLYGKGFRIFCGVGGSQPFTKVESDKKSIFQDRRPFDGYSITNRHESYISLIDSNSLIDPLRPLEVTRENTYLPTN